jgi:hypothetical protein
MKARTEGAKLETANVEPYRFCQARTLGISRPELARVASEAEVYRLRPEGSAQVNFRRNDA